MRFWKVWSCAAALVGSLAGTAQAQYQGYGCVNAPVVQFVEESEGPCKAGIMGGASLYILRPYHNNNAAFIVDSGIGTANPTQTTEDFDWNFKVAPAVWLGWSSACGVGFRGRYFHFDHASESIDRILTAGEAETMSISGPKDLSPTTPLSPRGFESPGVLLRGPNGTPLGQDNLTFNSDLRLQTIDAEATYAFDHGHFAMLVAVGGRYVQMHQNYRASLTNTVADDTFEFATLEAGRNFYGAGPTSPGKAAGNSVVPACASSATYGAACSSGARITRLSSRSSLPSRSRPTRRRTTSRRTTRARTT